MTTDTDSRDRVLIFRLGSIGDTVVALPCFHAIARAFSGYRRVLLTDSPALARASSVEAVLSGSGLIDDVIYYPVGDFSLKSALALMRVLRGVRATQLIYLAERMAAVPVYRDLLFFRAAGLPTIVAAPWNKDLRNCRIDPSTLEYEYEAERLARSLRGIAPVDLARSNWDLRLSAHELATAETSLKAVAGAPTVLAIAPGAKIAAKDWGADNWTELMKRLAPRYGEAAVVIVGADDERGLGDEVTRHWRGPVLNSCGKLTPREAAAVMRQCRLLICHDSGPMHLAASQETPCVALFGNRNQPRRWFPYGPGHHVIFERRGVREITVTRVVSHVRAALDGGSTTRSTTHGNAVGLPSANDTVGSDVEGARGIGIEIAAVTHVRPW